MFATPNVCAMYWRWKNGSFLSKYLTTLIDHTPYWKRKNSLYIEWYFDLGKNDSLFANDLCMAFLLYVKYRGMSYDDEKAETMCRRNNNLFSTGGKGNKVCFAVSSIEYGILTIECLNGVAISWSWLILFMYSSRKHFFSDKKGSLLCSRPLYLTKSRFFA